MPTPDVMIAAVHSYVDAFARNDPAAVRDLFAQDATVEDPVGTPLRIGHDAIHAFYTESMKTGAKLQLTGPVRCTERSAAFAFSVRLEMDGTPLRVDVIDVFDFDDAGKVLSMRAYLGPSNFSHGDAALT